MATRKKLRVPDSLKARFIRRLSGSFTPGNTIRPTVEALGRDYAEIKIQRGDTAETLESKLDEVHNGSVVVLAYWEDLYEDHQQAIVDLIARREDLDILVWHAFYMPWET